MAVHAVREYPAKATSPVKAAISLAKATNLVKAAINPVQDTIAKAAISLVKVVISPARAALTNLPRGEAIDLTKVATVPVLLATTPMPSTA